MKKPKKREIADMKKEFRAWETVLMPPLPKAAHDHEFPECAIELQKRLLLAMLKKRTQDMQSLGCTRSEIQMANWDFAYGYKQGWADCYAVLKKVFD